MVVVEFTTISPLLTNRTVQWSLNWCLARRVTNAWWLGTMGNQEVDCRMLLQTSAPRKAKKYCSRKIEQIKSLVQIENSRIQWRSNSHTMSPLRRTQGLGNTRPQCEVRTVAAPHNQPFLTLQARMFRKAIKAIRTKQQISCLQLKD